MNTRTIQKKIFDRLLSNGKVVVEKTENEVIVATDGTWAAKIPQKNVCFSLEKCTEYKEFSALFAENKEDEPLSVTDYMRKASYDSVLVKLVPQSGDFEVWVQKKLLDLCGDINLYGAGPLSPVKVRNYATDKIDAIIMPVRITP